jgi:hypothetical protein
MKHNSGKGDSPRNCFSKQFKKNYDSINWGHPKTIDEVFDLPKGSFSKFIKEKHDNERKEENKIKNRIIRKKHANDLINEPTCEKCDKVYCDCESKY